jgi:Asp-tRNA(Asn)/Glu-tRNA(Gln) amidotransferase A subunit family amidase
MTFKDLSLVEIIEKIKSGETSAQEVNSYFSSRINKYDKELNTFNFVNESLSEFSADTPLA